MKKGSRLLISLFLITLSINFASSVITVISPINGTNHSSANTVLFNVTFINNTDILIFGTSQSQINASFYSISGSTRTLLTNSSTCAVSSGTTYACWTTFTLSSSNDGFFNITATMSNATANRNASINTTSIYFDSTPPSVFASNFTSPLIGGNYSSTLDLSLLTFDATIGIQSVFFNITNATSGLQNATIVASNPTGNTWNASINTGHYNDGLYNITVYVNDSLNNRNNSAVIHTIYFDNTSPTATTTCTPNQVQEQETISCSCSGSDVLTGIASTSINANPSTSQTGTFTNGCTVTDRAGNAFSTSAQYQVTSAGGGTGPGLSPPPTSSSESATPPTRVERDSEDASSSESASGRGILSSTSGIIFLIITLAIVIAIVVAITKNRKR